MEAKLAQATKFEDALKNNRQAIVDGLRHENRFARGSTLVNLIARKAYDDAFIEAAEPLLDDAETFAWDTPVSWLAAVYLDVVGAKPYEGKNAEILELIEAARSAEPKASQEKGDR